jgi:hypothetical protein
MAQKYLTMINGVPTMVTIPVPLEGIVVVGSSVPIGTAISIPTPLVHYQGNELTIFLNNQPLTMTYDWNTYGSGSNLTQVTFTQILNTGDVLRFRIERSDLE